MADQTDDCSEMEDVSDRTVMEFLLVNDPGLWAVADLQREFRNPLDLEDSLNRLVGAGMAHRVGEGFVMASRTAKQASEMFGGI